jgi:hypothetical protein
MRFCGQKTSLQRIFIKKCFVYTVGSVCRVKRFTTGPRNVENVCWWRRGWNGGAEVAETTDKRLLCCGFRSTGKAMGHVYQFWWRICREINVFSSFKYHMIYVLYQFMICLLTLPRIRFYARSHVNGEKIIRISTLSPYSNLRSPEWEMVGLSSVR